MNGKFSATLEDFKAAFVNVQPARLIGRHIKLEGFPQPFLVTKIDQETAGEISLGLLDEKEMKIVKSKKIVDPTDWDVDDEHYEAMIEQSFECRLLSNTPVDGKVLLEDARKLSFRVVEPVASFPVLTHEQEQKLNAYVLGDVKESKDNKVKLVSAAFHVNAIQGPVMNVVHYFARCAMPAARVELGGYLDSVYIESFPQAGTSKKAGGQR